MSVVLSPAFLRSGALTPGLKGGLAFFEQAGTLVIRAALVPAKSL